MAEIEIDTLPGQASIADTNRTNATRSVHFEADRLLSSKDTQASVVARSAELRSDDHADLEPLSTDEREMRERAKKSVLVNKSPNSDSNPAPKVSQRTDSELEEAEPTETDISSRKSIERRNFDLRDVPSHGMTVVQARKAVAEDIASLHVIANRRESYFAAVAMSEYAEDQSSYRAELQRQSPETAITVAEAGRENERRVWAKEDRKRTDLHGLEIPPYLMSSERVAPAEGMHVKGGITSNQDNAEHTQRPRDVAPDTAEASPADQNRLRRLRQTATPPSSAFPSPTEREDGQPGHENARARAFGSRPAAEAVREFPELAATYAVISSMEKQANNDLLTSQQVEVVMRQVRKNVVNSIERGELPTVQLREQREVQHEKSEERERGR